jgi:GDPmannose 4,6-dehydratase
MNQANNTPNIGRPKVALVALIAGLPGQDGAYLSQLLLDKGYKVHGINHRWSLLNIDRIDHVDQDSHADHCKLTLHYGDMTNSSNLIRITQQVLPCEIYNVAAIDHVGLSFETAEYAGNADGIRPRAPRGHAHPEEQLLPSRRLCEDVGVSGT